MSVPGSSDILSIEAGPFISLSWEWLWGQVQSLAIAKNEKSRVWEYDELITERKNGARVEWFRLFFPVLSGQCILDKHVI